jgi:hypothetical protein
VSSSVYMFLAPGLDFGGTEGVGTRFNVLRFHTSFRRYRERSVPFSCLAISDSFSYVLRASGPVFMFCAPGPVPGGTKGAESNFHVLRSRTRFQRYRWRRVPFSCFALSNSFSTIPRAPCPVFMFYAPKLFFGGNKGVGSCFHVFRSRTRFQRYRGRQDPFFMFWAPRLV